MSLAKSHAIHLDESISNSRLIQMDSEFIIFKVIKQSFFHLTTGSISVSPIVCDFAYYTINSDILCEATVPFHFDDLFS